MIKKIAFVTTGDIKDIATAKRALGMANPLNELGWEVHIVMEDSSHNKVRFALECSTSIRIHYYKKCGAISEIRAKNRLIKQIKPDYVYICAFVFRNLVGINNSYLKLVEHSELQSAIPDIKGLKKISAIFLEYFSILYADVLLCASRYLEKEYIEKSKSIFRKTPIMYFPYAFSDILFRLKSQNEIPSHILKLENKKNFLFLGNITRNYGIFTMLEAFNQLSIKNIDTRLILLGKGKHYLEALSYVKENNLQDFVLMPGFVEEEDIANYFSIATAFISPMNDSVQDWARCPSKLYMYLPFMKPVISCEIGEPFQVLGTSGYYYETGSSQSMAFVIQELIVESIPKTTNYEIHTWEYRTKEFDLFINKCKINLKK